MKKDKILSLQSLRGVAAISIAFFHLNNNGYISYFFENAWLAVDFFFVLSGFVISLNYSEKISSINTFYLYQKQRFFRLYPLHFLMLMIFLGIEFLKLFVEIRFGLVANNRAFFNNNTTAFVANLFMVHNLVIPQPTFNYPSWSISAEFFTYAFFGIFILITKKSKLFFYFIALVLIFILGYVLFFTGFESDNITGPARCVYSFFIGVLTQRSYVFFNKSNIKILSTPSVLMFLTIIFLTTVFGHQNNGFIVFMPFVFALTILLLVLTEDKAFIVRLLNNKHLVYLGTISYGIYLIHALVWWFSSMFLRFVFQVPVSVDLGGKATAVIKNILLSDLISLVGVVIVVFLAHISHKYLEKRFI